MSSMRGAMLASTALALTPLQPSVCDAVLLVVPDRFATIQSAIDQASTGDSILVRAGTYSESLALAGKDILLFGESLGDSTVLDGERSHRLLTVGPGVTAATHLQDLTFRNGRADRGGAVLLLDGAAPRIQRCRFLGNEASAADGISPGGALYVTNGVISIVDCLFADNIADRDPQSQALEGEGGAIFTRGGVTLQVQRTRFARNVSRAGPEGGPGGALFLQYGTISTFEDCDFDGNTGFVGSCFRAYGDLTLRRCTFTRNHTAHFSAVSCTGDRFLVDGCLFFQNSTTVGGGVIAAEGSSVIRNSTIAFNDRCVGIFLGASEVLLENDIIAANGSAGVLCRGTPLTARCTDVWGNLSGTSPANWGGTCLDPTGTNGNIASDPLFCDAPAGDLRLHADSPCAPANGACGLVGALDVACGSTPVEVTDFEAHQDGNRVLLGWSLSREALLEISRVHVQRAASLEGPYSILTAIPMAASPRMFFEDRSVPAGSTCWYRLELVEPDAARRTIPAIRVRIVAPGARTTLDPPVELSGGRVEIRFHIAGATTAVRVSIYDVAGKRVRHFDLGIRSPGDYVYAWDREEDCGLHVPRGLFLVRLEAGSRAVARKLALVHE